MVCPYIAHLSVKARYAFLPSAKVYGEAMVNHIVVQEQLYFEGWNNALSENVKNGKWSLAIQNDVPNNSHYKSFLLIPT